MAPVAAAQALRKRWARAGAVAVLAAAAAAFGVELSQANLADVLARVQPWQAAAAAGWIALSLVAAAYNLTGFSAVRVPLWRSLQAQLAISGLRVFTPSAVSTPVVATRFLIRSGSSPSDALATAGAAQAVQLVATFAVVAGLAAVSGGSGPSLPSPAIAGAIAAGLAALLAIALIAARRSERVRRGMLEARESAARLGRHSRSHPAQALGGLLASAALTLTHVLAFAACVAAAGGHAPAHPGRDLPGRRHGRVAAADPGRDRRRGGRADHRADRRWGDHAGGYRGDRPVPPGRGLASRPSPAGGPRSGCARRPALTTPDAAARPDRPALLTAGSAVSPGQRAGAATAGGRRGSPC